MSERMIELQRARLLAEAQGQGGSSSATQNGSQPNRAVVQGQAPGAPVAAARHPQTPQQAAASAMRQEDKLMQRFLHRLQGRDDSRGEAFSGPTVPTALTRRILQKQGVGYLDDTVAAVVSASADRFLATVLNQAAACRKQRLKGADDARDAARHRKRHMQQYEADADDRKRRKEEKDKKREKANLAAIEAAEALKKTGMTPEKAAEEASTAKSKKKKKADSAPTNGNKPKQKDDEDDDASYDSIDEEEEYYRSYYGDQVPDVDEEEEDDEMLILRDVARPLEAWDFHLTGKQGLCDLPEEADGEDDSEDEEDEQEIPTGQSQDVDMDEASSQVPSKPAPADKGEAKSPGDGKTSRPSSRPNTPSTK